MFCKTVRLAYYCTDDVVCEIVVKYNSLSLLHNRICFLTPHLQRVYCITQFVAEHYIFEFPFDHDVLEYILLSLDLSFFGVSVIRFIDMKSYESEVNSDG